MSFGYLILTQNPCSGLTKIREGAFSLITIQDGWYAYFRFCENDFYTKRNGEGESEITKVGIEFLKFIGQTNPGKFIFSDVILQHREGEADFIKLALKQIREKNVSIFKIKKDLKFVLRDFYFIEIQ
ncbi:hypothetical protein [Neisseria weixii]|uniref:hypothetical protein n=1 Tax=Neisseria weixii TaxID=1853276 RepID=UPI00359F8E94